MNSCFIFAGEASGDLHGSALINALIQVNKKCSFWGVGGPRMRQQPFRCYIEMEEFQVMGFSAVLKALPRLWKHFHSLRNRILTEQPDAVILIDYPGFNLRLARALRQHGYAGKIIQYICPSVWAHGKQRIETLSLHYDLLLTIYPFESAYFEQSLLPVKYVGNPLEENIRTYSYQENWKKTLHLPSGNQLIALFPGSRLGEIKKNVPLQLQAAAELKKKHPHLIFALSCSQESLREELNRLIDKTPFRVNQDLFIVPPCFTYELMRACTLAVAKSGTVTLELALHATPTIVHYQLSPFNYFIAKHFLKLKLSHYCIVNILGNKTIFPEFIGKKISPNQLFSEMGALLTDSDQQKKIKKACEKIKHLLGTQATHEQSAWAIQELFT